DGQGNDSGTVTPPAGVQAMTAPELLDQAPVMGSSTSGVTVVEFSDYQCPFCGLAYGSPWSSDYTAQYGAIIGTVKKVETEYADTGKANFVHYPVAFLGEESFFASVASMCADEQGKYWEMHDAIFDAQTAEENNGKYSKDNLKLLAQEVEGLDMTAFNSCLDSDRTLGLVQDLTADWGTASRANTGSAGTPTFYVLVDSAKFSQEDVSAAADAGGYEWGLTSDGKTYVIVASPAYASLSATLDALVS
ncbi:MAG: DsbA family protein, partial [Candidatus Micrarchaeota archaeon]